jgi:hypothetical protein
MDRTCPSVGISWRPPRRRAPIAPPGHRWRGSDTAARAASSSDDRLRHDDRIDEVEPVWWPHGRAARVGIGEGRSEILTDPVEHELDRRRAIAAAPVAAAFEDLGKLFQSSPPIPPQGSHHVEETRLRDTPVLAVGHPGVLPAVTPFEWRYCAPTRRAFSSVSASGMGVTRLHEPHRPLVQRALRGAVGRRSMRPSMGRTCRGDAGSRQRLEFTQVEWPSRTLMAAGRPGRGGRAHRRRTSALVPLVQPPPAGQPLAGREMRPASRRSAVRLRARVAHSVRSHVRIRNPRCHGMHVGVDETGNQ